MKEYMYCKDQRMIGIVHVQCRLANIHVGGLEFEYM